MLVDALFVGLVVVRGDKQQAVGAQALVGERLGEHRLCGVGARAGDDGDTACDLLDHGGDNGVVLVIGHRGAFAGGAQGEDGVGAILQMEINKALERVKVDAAVLFKRRDEGDDRALEIADIHILLLRFCDLDAFVPLGGDGQALVLGATAGAFGARFGQQLASARKDVERGKVVARALGTTDKIRRAVGTQQYLGRAQAPVVVVAHGVAMCAGVVNHEQVAHVDLRQLTVDGELVVVLTQVARDIVRVRDGGCGFVRTARLTHYRDVVVGAIHGRANEIDGACVDADIVLVNLLFVDGLGDQASVGAHHKAAHLGADCHVAHAGGNQNLVVGCVYALADGVDVIGLLLGQVGDTHTAGQVDKGDMSARLALQAHGKLKEDARELGVVIVGDGVAGKEGMDAKILGTFGLERAEGIKELIGGHAVLGIARVVHNAVGKLEQAARVKTAAHRLGDGARDALVELDVADVVEVDDGA